MAGQLFTSESVTEGHPDKVADQVSDGVLDAFLAQDRTLFAERLETLVALRGRDTVRAWQALIAQGRVADAVHALLEQHYDPGYHQSIRRNFVQFADARPLPLENRSKQALASAARCPRSRPRAARPRASRHA